MRDSENLSSKKSYLHVESTSLPGVLLIKPRVFVDPRGSFQELYKRERYLKAGINCDFVQDNVSRSVYGVVRGMHYQLLHPQAKLVNVIRGVVLDVVIDIRQDSPSFGQFYSVELSEYNRWQLFIPEGFAHGFCAVSDIADFHYKCSTIYDPTDELGLHYETFGFRWPVSSPVISSRDQQLPPLINLQKDDLPRC